MSVEIKVPAVGESITEVVIGQWLVAAGSQVSQEQPLAVLETDKVNIEVPAPHSGVLQKILKPAGSTASIGEVIGLLEASATATAATPPPVAPVQASVAPTPAAASAPAPSPAFVMPAAARAAAAAQRDPAQLSASGPGGRLLKEDVLAASQASAPSAAAPTPPQPAVAAAGETVVPMTPMRRRIAERLVHAQQTAAILTTFNEVDMTQVMQLRQRLQETFVKQHGVKLGFMSFFVRAAVDALRAYPEVNAEVRGNDLVYRNYVDVGVAVGSDKGLVVPIVRRAEQRSFAEIEKMIADFGKRAVAGKLKLEEMQGGTFTISNGGVYGSLMSTPILNPPQSGILGMHAIVERPVGIAGRIELRPMMYVALSYDHRIVDGRGAVSFLRRVKECLEEPSRMLLEI